MLITVPLCILCMLVLHCIIIIIIKKIFIKHNYTRDTHTLQVRDENI